MSSHSGPNPGEPYAPIIYRMEKRSDFQDKGSGNHPSDSKVSSKKNLLDGVDVVGALEDRIAVVDYGIGILQCVTGTDTDDTLVLVDDSHVAQFLRSCDGCRGCGLDSDTLAPSEELLCCDDLLIGDCGGVSSGVVDRPECTDGSSESLCVREILLMRYGIPQGCIGCLGLRPASLFARA